MTPLVLVHGFMGGSSQWEEQQAAFGSEREVIALDLPGFGLASDAPPISTITGFATWALETLSTRGITQFDLLGHSMGGMIVQEMTRLAPDRVNRLVLYGTGPIGALPGRFETIETSMERARADGAPATARRISANWFLHGTKSPAYPACAAIAERSGLPAILAGLEAMRDWSGVDLLPHITCPTRIIWADQDRSYGWPVVETLWTNIPNAALGVIPDAGHAVHLEKPTLFNGLVADFLTQD